MYRSLMWLRHSCLIIISLQLWTAVGHAQGCKVIQYTELPVDMEGLRPIIPAKINGADARFVVDTGAYYSMLTPRALSTYKLLTRYVDPRATIIGIGGSARTQIARVDTFELGEYRQATEFLLADTEFSAESVGLLGQNFMQNFDVELDLANGVMRLDRTEGCAGKSLAYWAKNQPFGLIDLDPPVPGSPHTTGIAYVNGAKVHVTFDTGAPTSFLSLPAAKRAGITPASAGVRPAGTVGGLGDDRVRKWIAPLDSFKIGSEEIRNTQILIADIGYFAMLLGDDFFLAHRIFIANDQRKLYFTYNGGPVFALSADRRPQPVPTPQMGSAPGAAAGVPESSAAGSAVAQPGGIADFSNQPTDASGFARRGAAYAARNDLEHALADLDTACRLAPNVANYFYELGRVQWQARRPEPALEAFDKSIRLNPDVIRVRTARARLRLEQHIDAEEDLDAMDHLLPPGDDRRIELASLYGINRNYAAGVHQLDILVNTHANGSRLENVYNSRCWLRAEANQNLDLALADCNAALRLQPKDPAFLDSRGLVHLRRREFDLAIADYDGALSVRPKEAASLYGRGLAKLQQGARAAGQADLDAAIAIQPGIAVRFADFGLRP